MSAASASTATTEGAVRGAAALACLRLDEEARLDARRRIIRR